MHKVQEWGSSFVNITLLAQLYVSVGIVLTFAKHVHDRFISLIIS